MEETKVDELRIEAGSRAVKYEKKSRTRYINSSLQKLMFEDWKKMDWKWEEERKRYYEEKSINLMELGVT